MTRVKSENINILTFQDLLLKLKNTKNLPTNFSLEGNLVMDPDLIDLTMIPPPMTPDEVIFDIN